MRRKLDFIALNSGIGLETARDLAARGARLILAVGNMEKGINAAKDIVETTGNNNLVVRKLDLASIEEVRKFAQQVNDAEEKLDTLILNGNTVCQVVVYKVRLIFILKKILYFVTLA